MRHMGLNEPFDRLAVFFKNLALGQTGEQLAEVEAEVKEIILSFIANPEDCVWTRLLTPRDLQQTFGFPGSSTYPCGSVAGTPGYMCASELLRHMGQ